MRRSVAAILLVSLLVLAGFSAWPAMAQTGTCQLAPVFMMLRDLVGRERVGECTSAVIRNDAGDLTQTTTFGIMTLRPSDLVTQFSDGQTVWLFGPRGLESRASTSRLPWETGSGAANTGNGAANPGAGSQSVTSSGASASVAPPPPLPSPAPHIVMPIKLEGESSATTRQFDLAGGDYWVTWEAERVKDNDSCYLGSRLRRIENANPGALVVHTTLNRSNDRTSSGETRLFAVAPGRYVLDVMTTGCSWKITLQLPK
jgi:hypothetical protein